MRMYENIFFNLFSKSFYCFFCFVYSINKIQTIKNISFSHIVIHFSLISSQNIMHMRIPHVDAYLKQKIIFRRFKECPWIMSFQQAPQVILMTVASDVFVKSLSSLIGQVLKRFVVLYKFGNFSEVIVITVRSTQGAPVENYLFLFDSLSKILDSFGFS